MLRLTRIVQTPAQIQLTIDGRLVADQVPLLDGEIGRCLAHATRLVLQLDGVTYIDEAGLALLKRWRGQTVCLRGGSPFVQALLQRAGLTDA